MRIRQALMSFEKNGLIDTIYSLKIHLDFPQAELIPECWPIDSGGLQAELSAGELVRL